MNHSPQTDLRDFLADVADGGELKCVTGAHWDKEVGAVTEVLYREKIDTDGPMDLGAVDLQIEDHGVPLRRLTLQRAIAARPHARANVRLCPRQGRAQAQCKEQERERNKALAHLPALLATPR